MRKISKKILKIVLLVWGIIIVLFLIIPEDSPDEHYVQGILYFQKGQYDQAISELTSTIRITPWDIQAYRYRGLAYINKGELDEAILNFNEAIEIDPRSTLDYIHRGNAYRAKGEYDLAISDYNKAIEINPRSFNAYSERSSMYEAMGEHDLAVIDQNKAIELEADKYFRSGNSFYERIKTRGDKAVVSESDYYYENGKWIYKPSENLRESDMAISNYTKAIEMDPNYSKAYINRADVYFMKGEYSRAWEDVNNAQRLGLDVPTKFLDSLRKASGRED